MNHSRLDAFTEVENLSGVTCVNRRCETVLGRICKRHCFFVILRPQNRQHRSKNLFPSNAMLGLNSIEDRRLDKEPTWSAGGFLAASHELRTFTNSGLNVSFDSLQL